ncbi:unnamed protein product, partial [Darwinula stevensoni]
MIVPSGIGKKRLSLLQDKVVLHGGRLVSSFEEEGRLTHVIVDDMLSIDGFKKYVEDEARVAGVPVLKTQWLSRCLAENAIIPLGEHQMFAMPKICPTVLVGTSLGHPHEEQTKEISINKDGFACAHASGMKTDNVNQLITEELGKLAKIYKNSNDHWRALTYERAINQIKKLPKPISSYEEAKVLHGIGPSLADKIWEIVEQGKLRKAEKLSEGEKVRTLELFTSIWGVGATTAELWYGMGLRNLNDVKTKAHLTHQQQIGLKCFDDLLERMSRAEAGEIAAVIRKAVEELCPGTQTFACGSYRRGKSTCGDVDVLVTHPDGVSHEGLFQPLLKKLKLSGFLTDDLMIQEQSTAQQKYLGVCKLHKENAKYRRLDIIVMPYGELAPALMYFTGSAHFNRSMRLLANKMGMSLSEHGLRAGVVRQGREKVNDGHLLETPTEASIFQHLGLEYRPPEDRDH